MNNFNKTLLIVDDEALIAMAQAEVLESAGYTVMQAYSGESALEIIREGSPPIDLILMDIDLGDGMNGIETTKEIIKSINVPIVFVTSYPESLVLENLKSIGVYGYVIKTSGEDVLIETIRRAFNIQNNNEDLI